MLPKPMFTWMIHLHSNMAGFFLASTREQIKRKSERGRGRGKEEHVMKELQKKKKKKTIAPVL